jgi:hypothetical protein
MKSFLSITLAALAFAAPAFAGTYEDAVRERYLRTDLAASAAVQTRVQELADEGYTEAGEAKVIYLQTLDCTPGCRHTLLVAQPYSATSAHTPANKSLVAVYDLVVTPGQITEYYPTLTKVLTADELSQALSLAE